MEEEKGERVCGFLKIVFEGFVFFFNWKSFYSLYWAGVLFLNTWKDVQNGFKGGITHTVETPKIGSLWGMADTPGRISNTFTLSASRMPASGPGGDSLTRWSLATKGEICLPRYS